MRAPPEDARPPRERLKSQSTPSSIQEQAIAYEGTQSAFPPDPGGIVVQHGGDSASATGREGTKTGSSPEALPPEVFYSMKQTKGKDAVGTFSGPGTLEIGRRGGRGKEHDSSKAHRRVLGDTAAGVEGCAVHDRGRTQARFWVQTLLHFVPWGKASGYRGDAQGKAGAPRHSLATAEWP